MITTTTHTVEGKKIARYCGIVSGEAIMGANIFRDFMAEVSDIVGGRVSTYERKFEEAKQVALRLMIDKARMHKASAIVGIAFSYQSIGERGSILMVATTGTAVVLEGDARAPAVTTPAAKRLFIVQIDGQESGPHDDAKITELFASGIITDETSACIWEDSGPKHWKPLAAILG